MSNVNPYEPLTFDNTEPTNRSVQPGGLPQPPHRGPASRRALVAALVGVLLIGGGGWYAIRSSEEAAAAAAAVAAEAVYRNTAWCVADKLTEGMLLMVILSLSGEASQTDLADAAIPLSWASYAAMDFLALTEPSKYAGSKNRLGDPMRTVAALQDSPPTGDSVAAWLNEVQSSETADQILASLKIHGIEEPVKYCIGVPAPYDR